MSTSTMQKLTATLSIWSLWANAGWHYDGVGYTTPDIKGYRTEAVLFIDSGLREPVIGLLYWDLNCTGYSRDLVAGSPMWVEGHKVEVVHQCYRPHYRLYLPKDGFDSAWLDTVFYQKETVTFTNISGQHPRTFDTSGYAEVKTSLVSQYRLMKFD